MTRHETTDAYRQYVKPLLAESLATMGLDVTYERAQGNYVYLRDAAGHERAILDMVGGNGSLLFGHNHPRVIDEMRQALADGMIVHGQLSIRREAGLLAEALARIARRDTGIDDGFVVHFGNSGAEAIECALKHAEVSRMARLWTLADAVRGELEALQREVRAGAVRVADEALADEALVAKLGRADSLDALIERALAHNHAQLRQRPLFVAIEHAFHGRLVASVQLTYGAAPPYRNMGLQTRFLPLNDVAAVDALAAELARDPQIEFLGLAVEGGRLQLASRTASPVAGVLLEPIQGEAGVLVATRAYGEALRRFCDQQGCPLIVDEIQSGMGRTGRFFAASKLGIQGDYYTLAKSLGAGVAKISAVMFRASQYQHDFALHHSSTFAEDDLSCRAARVALELLERDDGAVYGHIEAMGGRMRAALDRLHKAYPDVIAEVRGVGLFLAIDFAPPASSASPLLRTLAQFKLFGYVMAGYLLKNHNIRIAPTGSAVNLLRFHPSIGIDDEIVDTVEAAVRQLCEVIRHDDVLHLIFPLTGAARPAPRAEIRDFRHLRSSSSAGAALGPGMTLEAFRAAEPALAELSDREVGGFLMRLATIARRIGSLAHRQL